MPVEYLLKCSTKESKRFPKQNKTIYNVANALACSTEFGGKSLLLKTTQILDTEFGEIWPYDLEASSLKTFFPSIGQVVQSAKGENQSITLSLNAMNHSNDQHARYFKRYNNDTNILV